MASNSSEGSSAWKQATRSVKTTCADALVELCWTRSLDCGRAIREVAQTISLVIQINPSYRYAGLFSKMMMQIVPGLGWREYYECLPGDKSRDDHLDHLVPLFEQMTIDRDRLGRILLVILEGEPAQAIRTIQENAKHLRLLINRCKKVDIVVMTAIACAKIPSPDLFEYAATLIYKLETDRVGMLARHLAIAIRKSNLEMLQKMIPLTNKQSFGKEPLLTNFWTLATICSRTTDPDSTKHQIMALVMSYLRDDDGMLLEKATVKLNSLFSDRLRDPNRTGFILWVVRNHPELVQDQLRVVTLSRWAAKDRFTLFELMRQYSIEREQLLGWYQEADDCSHPDDRWAGEHGPPAKEELDLDWLESLRVQKSGYSCS